MTREEAIDYIKNLIEYMRITDKESEYKFLEESYEALDLAIKALEQEPKTGHYKDRREQRKVTEAMNALLLPLLPYLSSEMAIVVKRALHLLREIEVEPQEGEDG